MSWPNHARALPVIASSSAGSPSRAWATAYGRASDIPNALLACTPCRTGYAALGSHSRKRPRSLPASPARVAAHFRPDGSSQPAVSWISASAQPQP